ITVVGEADDARGGYAVVEQLRPDVVVLDIMLPGIDGVAASREILRRVPSTKVLILSAYAHADRVREAFAAGISGYAGKDQSAAELVDALRRVAAGERSLAPRIEALFTVTSPAVNGNGETEPLHLLSPREREIFELIIRGFSNEAIARELSISAKT